jgi:adenylate cyclase
MVGPAGSTDTRELEQRAKVRLRSAMIAANSAGALVVFLFANVVLPNPPGLHHTTRLILINAGAFIVAGGAGLLLADRWSGRLWEASFGWAHDGRAPTQREVALTLRHPLRQQGRIAAMWTAAACLFSAVNAPFSMEVANNAAITIVLGGLVTCSSGYLLCERITRPLTAIALSTSVPRRPQLPGVAARAILSWTLGTGAILFGVALVGIGGLHERTYTRERLAIAMLVLSVVGLTVGLATMFGLARSLATPIEALRRAVGRVERGDLDQEVTVDDGSEIGLLQAGFNQMLAGLREREQLRDLFGRHVGEDVARHALENGAALGGQARDAAVLFVDVQGSTTLAQTRDPSEVVKLLNEFFAIVVEVVAAHHGWVNKFEGDAALCVFGAPLEDPEAANHALDAALELRDRLAAELDQITAGIGVSAGRVVAGNIGAAERFEYTVIGDPVNEAARLTELAKGRPGRVLASEAAVARASAEIRARWDVGDELRLRGRFTPTRVAMPVTHQLQPAAADR